MENEYAEWIYFGISLVIAAWIIVAINSSAKNTLIGYLRERGAKDIVVIREWLSFDRTITFFVEFTHPDGNKISTYCKFGRLGTFEDGEIFWSVPTNLEPPKPKTK
ncbi:MAG TPA: hypothetical protein PKE35_17530 [Anaerolineales bacterium]|nr:hypothetical protein [Anaerolineales bacterium]HNC90769.1 hypothetical protein [Anaerolineales bacterium]HND93425.1 hypothetical protein [Anaerolineales bacterium]HNH80352.1 hypothetical protein [Anaerolineales bacterium]HUM26380.1 hypothetical protein [Anaerolineales bacterium]